MQTSKSQLALIASLAAGFGYTLSPSEAVGYPVGAAVSLGTNPVWSVAGNITSSVGTADLVSAPAEQDLVVTDIQLASASSSFTCAASFTLDTGTQVGRIRFAGIREWGWYGHQSSFESGIRVPAGQNLNLSTSSCGIDVDYMLTGYYAQP